MTGHSADHSPLFTPCPEGVRSAWAAKFYVDRGWSALKGKQRHVLLHIFGDYDRSCEVCAEDLLPLEELTYAYYHEGRCSYCQHKYDKLMKE